MAPFGSHTLYVQQAVRMQVTELGSVKGEGKAYNQALLSWEVIIISPSCTYIIHYTTENCHPKKMSCSLVTIYVNELIELGSR